MDELIPKLTSDEVWFFYKVLYRYEKEKKHTGYNWNKVSSELKDAIKIDHSFKKGNVPKTNKDNTLNFKCYSVARDFLKHLRHAFAHGGIESDGDFFVITSYDKAKLCSMSGRIEKILLEKLTEEVIASYTPNRINKMRIKKNRRNKNTNN